MRPAAEVMLELATSGLDAKQLALVMELSAAVASEGKADPAAEKRRAYDRDRKARLRDEARSGGIPVDSADITDAPLSPSPNENNSNPHPHTPGDITTRARGDFPKPDWCDPQVWRDLKANRKAKRLPCTATAHAKLLRDIDKLVDEDWPPGRLLEAIVARGWAAAYDPRDERKPANDQHRTNRPSTRDIGMRLAARLDGGNGIANDRLPRLGSSSGHG